MNKLVLVFGTLFVLCVFLSERAEGGKFLDNLCEKCSYCKIDPTCSGCADCSKCVNKKVRLSSPPDLHRYHSYCLLRATADTARSGRARTSARLAVLRAAVSAEERTGTVCLAV